MKLFMNDERPLEDLLTEVRGLSPKFTLWVGAILRYADGAEIIENILRAVIKTGLAENREEGLRYLNDFCVQHPNKNPVVAYSDLLGQRHTRQFKRLERLLSYPVSKCSDIYRFYGIISHQAVYDLLTGKVPNFHTVQELLKSMNEIPAAASANLLGHGSRYIQQSLFGAAEIFSFVRFLSEITPDNHISQKLKNEITTLQSKILIELKRQDHWTTVAATIGPAIHELRARLFPIFGSHINALTQYDRPGTEYLMAVILVSWLAALPLLDIGRPILFKELPVLSPDLKLGGGRLDILELLAIDGKQPSGWQVRFLKEMAEGRFKSTGRLMHELEMKLGPNLSFRIIDLKFAIGDSVERGRIIQPEDVTQPLAKHLEQIKRYITLANLDYHLHCRGKTLTGIWSGHSPVRAGRLIYFLAAEEPVVHEIVMTPEEQTACFTESIASRFHGAKFRAVIRNLNNLLVGRLNSQLTGRSANRPKTNGAPAGSLNLFPDAGTDIISEILDRHRCFADENKIIERIGGGGKCVHLMHLGRLLDAIRKGSVKGDFSLERGRGSIGCLMPGHDDPNPSMHIDLGRGIWKCFGCGVYGFFAETSIEQVPNLKAGRTGRIPMEFKKTRKIVIPDEHHNIMSLAQEILNSQFKESPAQDYVAGRALDSELAYSLRAGYGSNELINVLLDSYDYDQLIHYGFLAISSKISSTGGICPLLTKRGMRLDQMKRQANTKFGLPYSVLARRVTFPLAFEGRMTNFYGRAMWQCEARYKHRKLSVEHTGVPHGAFNIESLSADHPEIIIAEGTFDALSLIQMSYPATMAMIGVNNQVIIEAIARSGKNLAIALDIDPNKTGQNNTAKILSYLKSMGHSAQVRDFTQDFTAAHPDFLTLGCKDFNEYLIAKTKTAF